MGNRGDTKSGDVRWMTAGRGSFIKKCPRETVLAAWEDFSSGRTFPASQKMMEPCYRDVSREQIPEVSLEGGVRVNPN
jgi:hypothetical protein